MDCSKYTSIIYPICKIFFLDVFIVLIHFFSMNGLINLCTEYIVSYLKINCVLIEPIYYM